MLGVETYTVTRYGAQSLDASYAPTAAVASTHEIEASVQPLSGRELEALPELDRERHNLRVYTTFALRTEGPDGSSVYPADRLAIDGEAYEVREVQRWRSLAPIPHYKARAVRLAREEA